MLGKFKLSAVAFATSTALTSCFAITDTERFSQTPEGCDVDLTLSDFGVHQAHQFTMRLVQPFPNSTSPRLDAIAVISPLAAANIRIHMPLAVRARQTLEELPTRLDFFADNSGNGRYDPPSADHTWVLPDACGGPYVFPHNLNFVPLETPSTGEDGIVINRCGSEVPNGATVEVRVMRDEPVVGVGTVRRAVALFRGTVSASGLRPMVQIPFSSDIAFGHTFEILVDLDADGRLDGNEKAYRYEFPANGGACLPVAAACAVRGTINACQRSQSVIEVPWNTASEANVVTTLTHEAWVSFPSN